MNTIGSYICKDIFSTTAFTNTTLATSAFTEELLTTQPTLTKTNTLAPFSLTTQVTTTTTKPPLPTSYR